MVEEFYRCCEWAGEAKAQPSDLLNVYNRKLEQGVTYAQS